MATPGRVNPEPGVGECAGCARARVITSERGSRFYLCQRAAEDDRYPRYPRLPMHGCPGFEEID